MGREREREYPKLETSTMYMDSIEASWGPLKSMTATNKIFEGRSNLRASVKKDVTVYKK